MGELEFEEEEITVSSRGNGSSVYERGIIGWLLKNTPLETKSSVNATLVVISVVAILLAIVLFMSAGNDVNNQIDSSVPIEDPTYPTGTN